MFSVFGKRKPAATPTEDFIQGPADAPRPSTGDDFVFIERKPSPAAPGRIYPPAVPFAAPESGPPSYNYLDDIPFQLSPQLTTKDASLSAEQQMDAALALLTRQVSVDRLAEEYTFALERSVQKDSN
ncbi:uncharacterized protein LOC117590780 [Drosophila guanche]|uniref:UMA domain-containing protein n=1 Tax=Drosophila guanche TaxID=7266 RepID=A0A3B0KTP5_DROGU|nr:uncharacterized protein LOC117590780 [Drosophila guanche]SPP89166.1 Hypothetical predicted protein [Drosophila guanche]